MAEVRQNMAMKLINLGTPFEVIRKVTNFRDAELISLKNGILVYY